MTDTPAPASSRAEQDSNQYAQRENIRLAAVRLFTRQGFAGTSMKQLATVLDMAPGNLYNYYPNKEAILFDVLEHQLLNMLERDRAIIEHDASPPEQLRSLTHDLVANDLNDPTAAFVGIQGVKGLSEKNSAYISHLMGEIRSSWAKVIMEGKDNGYFDLQDPKLCTLSVLTLCSSVSTWFQPDGEYSAEYVAEAVAEMALRMAGCQ